MFVLKILQTPKEHATYLTSVKFARDMLRLCARAGPIFENEPRCLFIQSPVYVFGDIHGNLEVSPFFTAEPLCRQAQEWVRVV